MTPTGLEETATLESGQESKAHLNHPLNNIYLLISVRFWALLLPLMARTDNLDVLLKRCAPAGGTYFMGISAPKIARQIRKAVRKPYLMRDRPCLREGLLLFRFLTIAGYRVTLHFGVDRTSIDKKTMSAHCWVVLKDQTYLPPDNTIVEIARYSANNKNAVNGKVEIERLPMQGAPGEAA